MQLSEILQNFLSLTQDAIGIGYRGPDDQLGKLVYVNQAYEELFGRSAEDVLGRPASISHDPDTWQSYLAIINSRFASGESSFSTEAKCIRADGSKFWASLSFFVVPDDENGGRYTAAVFRDISDLKTREEEAERALRDRETLLRDQDKMYNELLATQTRFISAINAYPDPFVVFDADLNLVTCNTAYKRSMSTNPDAIRPGMHVREVLVEAMDSGTLHEPEQGRQAYMDELLGPERIGRKVEDLEFPGDIHHRMLRSQAENGDWVLIRLDITELVRQKRTAEEAQDRLLSAISSYPSPFSICDSNAQLIVWNPSYAQSLTNNPDEIQAGMTLEQAMRIGVQNGRFPDAIGREEAWLKDILHSARNGRAVEDITLADDTHHRVLRSKSTNGDLVMIRLDTTELVRQRRALEEIQSRLISAINAFPDPFAIYDSDIRLLTWNPAFTKSLTDNPDDVFVGMSVDDVIRLAVKNGHVPAAKGREAEWLDEYVTPDMPHTGTEEFEFDNDRHYRIMRSRSENGELLVLRLNITEAVRQRRALEDYAKRLEDANHEITHKALHDELTGLGNRRYLSDKFEQLSTQRRQEGGDLAALHIDLDRFKQINDTIGHAAGDHVLVDVANRIRVNVRQEDVIARIGGDEFVILLLIPEDSDRPKELAQALLDDLSKPSFFEGRECRFGASIGIARTPLANEEDLLTNSDVALYKAKRSGRGQIGIFDRTDIDEMRRTKNLADDIMRALEAREFLPYYQPQIDAQTGKVVGVEALARWLHPTKGVRAPDSFLPVATDLNIVAEIDRMIFEKAIIECEETLGRLPEPPSLSFNVSARRIQFDEIAEIGRLAGGYSGKVAFELLETIFLEEESDAFLMQLDQLRDMGISLEVDDFGSGRASIVALQRIAPDQLKIDRRLVTPMTEHNSASRLVQSIIEIGNALQIGVTAEGVETAEQARILAKLGAQRLQGYYFSKPLSLPGLVDYLNTSTVRRHQA
ncbi:EAL domain-containing protein [Actibacterium sp. 188UL27-1]|uniref:sensor domain-containing protein n=1 Tax=Actibacterium sp. 188UL27-1 TaxID=2786961 RepID=UPI001959AFC5|nr:EAL domain-containing protein [Actibacterium sp. 188UL27-1]MBM7069002.1 EAL domain-containing protein [Actibacterium sp. 188UL27-1]